MSLPSGERAVRWILPLAIIAAGGLLSAWVYLTRLAPTGLRGLPVLLWAGPAFSLVAWWTLRSIVDRYDADPTRSADLAPVWVVVFLFGLHAAILAAILGLISSLDRAVPVGVAVFDVGIAAVLLTLAPGSVMGLRTAATLSSPRLWQRAHRWGSACLAAAGVAALAGLLFRGWWALVYATVPSIFAVLVAALHARSVRDDVGEDPGPTPGAR